MSLAPHLHLHFEFQHSCNNPICCIRQNEESQENGRRLVSVEENRPSAPVRAWRAFKRACCCCGQTDDEEQNEKVLQRFEELMIKEYGELPVKTAYELAKINLDDKKPLHERDVRKIMEKAEFVQQNIQELDGMVAQIRHASPRIEEVEEPVMEMALYSEQQTSLPKFKPGFVSALTEIEVEEEVIDEVVHKELELVPAKEKITMQQARSIVDRVETTLKEQPAEKVSRLAVRRIVSKNIRDMQIPTEEPEFLKDLDPEIKETLKERFNVEALTPRECAALAKALKKKKKTTPNIDEVD